MNWRIFVLVAAIAFLQSCSTQFTGTKPGAGQAEFSNDFLECRAMSKRLDGYEHDTTIKDCMQSKGWTITTKTTLW